MSLFFGRIRYFFKSNFRFIKKWFTKNKIVLFDGQYFSVGEQMGRLRISESGRATLETFTKEPDVMYTMLVLPYSAMFLDIKALESPVKTEEEKEKIRTGNKYKSILN